MLDHLGCAVRKQTVTEHHITADLMDVDFTKTGLINIHRWIARAEDQDTRHKDYITNYVSFDKCDFMLRCYDKTAELNKKKQKETFFTSTGLTVLAMCLSM